MNKNILIFGLVIIVILAGVYIYKNNNSSIDKTLGEFSQETKGLKEVKAYEIVELKNGDTYNMTAGFVSKEINGKKLRMLAYNGSIPGPLVKVEQGSEIKIKFTNDTDQETTLHSHGLRLDNQFDGVPEVTQDPIKPGDSFEYKLKFPDAGMYWYHPHMREDYQQELGMYGNFLVTPKDADYWSPVNREESIFLDDILIENGQLNFDKEKATLALMGRYGNTMLINGQTDYSLSAKKGEVIRLYLTNSANARPFNFAIPGVKMKLVGGDGGAHEIDEWVDSVVVGPSERAIVEVMFDQSGSFKILNQTPNKSYDLGVVSVSEETMDQSFAEQFNQLKTHQGAVNSISSLKSYFDKVIGKQINLTLDMLGEEDTSDHSGQHMMPGGEMMGGSAMSMGMMMGQSPDGIEWDDTNEMMNRMSDSTNIQWNIEDENSKKQNMDIDWVLKQNEPVKIRIVNDEFSAHPMQHPIHFHGQQFLVLSRDGVKETNLVWKDTVTVPAGQTYDILLNPTNLGTWMAHCHISEHLESGMMFSFKVIK